MKRVTRDIDPSRARDLLDRVPRACLSFAGEHGPHAEPIVFVWHDGRYLAGVHPHARQVPRPGQEVVLLIDEGVYFFDLRAISIRGRLVLAEAPRSVPADHRWFEVVSAKVIAWDYGTLREVRDGG